MRAPVRSPACSVPPGTVRWRTGRPAPVGDFPPSGTAPARPSPPAVPSCRARSHDSRRDPSSPASATAVGVRTPMMRRVSAGRRPVRPGPHASGHARVRARTHPGRRAGSRSAACNGMRRPARSCASVSCGSLAMRSRSANAPALRCSCARTCRVPCNGNSATRCPRCAASRRSTRYTAATEISATSGAKPPAASTTRVGQSITRTAQSTTRTVTRQPRTRAPSLLHSARPGEYPTANRPAWGHAGVWTLGSRSVTTTPLGGRSTRTGRPSLSATCRSTVRSGRGRSPLRPPPGWVR
ncbi:hypothetical protein OK074_6727 [Actinobacteria bacterium OK074]|nr:hypothetical protein OK074_6727 [Actinobacteria bacterium OK074]